jgi:hypothetical protein
LQRHVLTLEKILGLAALVFCIPAVFVLVSTGPAHGYEVSVFDAYPYYFWLFLIASIACCVFSLVYQAIESKKSKWLATSLLMIVLVNSIFLLLPAFRGYVTFGRYDTLTHLGLVKDILVTGHIGQSNFYPITHLLVSSLVEVVGLPTESVVYLLVALFSTAYILGIYLLVRSARVSSNVGLLILAFASPLIYSGYQAAIYPSFLSLLFVPYLISFYQNREFLRNRRQYTVLLLLAAFFIALSHPVTATYVIVILLVFGFSRVLYIRFIGNRTSGVSRSIVPGKNSLAVGLIMLMTLFAWYLPFTSIQSSFMAVYDGLVYHIGKPLILSTVEPLAGTGLSAFQVFRVYVFRFGAVSILLLGSIICSFATFLKIRKKQNVPPLRFAYSILLFSAIFVGAMFLFGYFPNEYEPVRAFTLSLLVATIVTTMVVYDSVRDIVYRTPGKIRLRKSGFLIIVGMLIVIMVALSVVSIYGSAYTSYPNDQVTQMDITGSEWFERSFDSAVAVVANVRAQIPRFEDFSGVDTYPYVYATVDSARLPSHFGYEDHASVAEALGLNYSYQRRYVMLFQRDRLSSLFFPENARAKVPQYTEDDFVKISSDITADLLYVNGETEVWMIRGPR